MLYFEHFETSWRTRETCSIFSTLEKLLGCYIFNAFKQSEKKTIEMLYFQHFETSMRTRETCSIFNTLKQSGKKTIVMLYFQHFETSWKTRETCSIVKTLKQSARTRVPCSYIFILYFSTLCNSLKKLERRLLFSTL